jgi:hypothetical protein
MGTNDVLAQVIELRIQATDTLTRLIRVEAELGSTPPPAPAPAADWPAEKKPLAGAAAVK